MPYAVSIGKYVRTITPGAKNRYRCSNRTTYTTSSETHVAEDAITVLREAGMGMRYSGMEEFGEAHAVWTEGHECPENGSQSDECERLELESCRDWIENFIRHMPQGDSEGLHLSLPDGFIEFVITNK